MKKFWKIVLVLFLSFLVLGEIKERKNYCLRKGQIVTKEIIAENYFNNSYYINYDKNYYRIKKNRRSLFKPTRFDLEVIVLDINPYSIEKPYEASQYYLDICGNVVESFHGEPKYSKAEIMEFYQEGKIYLFPKIKSDEKVR